jgi:RNA polymerase sigma factor (sigma-70 family)
MPSPVPSSTAGLVARARLGDSGALGQLIGRYLPWLRRWAHGRLSRAARAAADTADVVQDALLHTIGRLNAFESRSRGALGRYLRVAVQNRIRDEHRRVSRRGTSLPVDEALADAAPSPFDRAAALERHARYREALARLDQSDQELIVGHVELDYSHEQLGCMTGRTPNAARMALQRAVARLAANIRED